MKKVIALILFVILVATTAYYSVVYYLHFSEGYRAGELIKISHKGVIFKTWEGEISQGVSESQRFVFSVEEKETEVIEKLKHLQGKQVNLTYIERFGTFPWLGDTKYFVTKVDVVKKEKPALEEIKKDQNSIKESEHKQTTIDTIEI